MNVLVCVGEYVCVMYVDAKFLSVQERRARNENSEPMQRKRAKKVHRYVSNGTLNFHHSYF